MTTLTSDQQAALELAVVRPVVFVEFQFAAGTTRLCSFAQNIDYGGNTWIGLGQVGSVSAIEDDGTPNSKPMNFTLSIADATLLYKLMTAPEDYRGRMAYMYMAPLDTNHQVIGPLAQCWSGVMDNMSLSIDGDQGSISLKCESEAYAFKRRTALRMNSANLNQKYPNARGLDYLPSLISQPQLWISVAFQRQD